MKTIIVNIFCSCGFCRCYGFVAVFFLFVAYYLAFTPSYAKKISDKIKKISIKKRIFMSFIALIIGLYFSYVSYRSALIFYKYFLTEKNTTVVPDSCISNQRPE